MGGGKCQLCMKESATVERMWRGRSRVIRRGRMGRNGRAGGVGVKVGGGVIPRSWQETQGTDDKLCVF